MNETEWLAGQFERHRPHLRAVAYRMLGSLTEADDAVQDTWLRLSRSGAADVENLGGWLTTITARVCLNMLRSRTLRREEPLGVHIPDPVISPDGVTQPEEQALLADSVGLALLVVLDTLTPDERLAFVLHDMFDLPFAEIAAMLGRTPAAAKQLASRARRHVQGAGTPAPDPDPARQREVVDAFFAAGRRGDFDALVALLHPDVVLRADFGARRPAASVVTRGAEAVARQALLRARAAARVHPALVNGAPGVVITMRGRPFAVMSFTVTDGKIAEIDTIADPERVRRIAAAVLPAGTGLAGAPPRRAVRPDLAGRGLPAGRAERGVAQVRQAELRVRAAGAPRARAAVEPDPPGERQDGERAPETRAGAGQSRAGGGRAPAVRRAGGGGEPGQRGDLRSQAGNQRGGPSARRGKGGSRRGSRRPPPPR